MAHVRQEAARHLPSHLTPPRTGHKPRTHTHTHTRTDSTALQTHKPYTVVTGDGGGFNTKERRCVGRRATSVQCARLIHNRCEQVLAEPIIARVACIFGLTARVRLLAPSAPVPGLAPTQIPPKGGLVPRREGKSGSGQKVTTTSAREES